MRRLRLIKAVVPEIVAYFGDGSEIEDMMPDYRCPACGVGVVEEYVFCPNCGSELKWKRVKQPSERFLKIVNRL